MQNLAQEKPVNKNRTLIIITIIVVALCGCLLAVAAGLYAFIAIRPAESSSIQPMEEYEFDPAPDVGIGNPPEGGLGNDILKNDTWDAMVSIAEGQGCKSPSGTGSSIDVLQQPENGIWYEKWTIMCSSGESYFYEVEFILDDTGATFNISSLQ